MHALPTFVAAVTALFGAFFALGAAAGAGSAAPPGKLHVPSPDWRDQIVYFVVTDRFADGNPGNNDQGADEFKAGDGTRYNGGDLAGLRARLPYIRGLGATALWITPPVANQWLNPGGTYSGYHGYWAENFMRVDRHLGTLADYQALSRSLHAAGMFLVQDIVVNHTGDYFFYRGGWDAADPTRFYVPQTNSPPVARPTQPPFDQNDPRDPAQRRAGIYHWTPDVADYNERRQELTFQMAGLDDLNTENPAVRRALRQSYGHWIREAGVDAYRVDTAFYVPPEFFADFLHARDPRAPGIARVAQRTGRRQFLVFGEGFGIDRPGDEQASRKIESYMRDEHGRPLMQGMLNFPLYGALGDAFARGRPPAELGQRITRMLTLHARPHLMPSFVDNHDVDRYLAGGNVAGLKQALLALMTLPGIPVIYYGTEQGFTEQRGAMFAAGFGSGGRDHFDTAASLYRAIAEMSALRRTQRLFSRGLPTVLHGNAAQPGALAWRTVWRGQAALVAFNTADSDTLLAALDTGLPAGTLLQGLYGIDGRPADVVVGAAGRVTLRLPPRAGLVWKAAGHRAVVPPSAAALTLETPAQASHGGDFEVGGTARGVAALQLVVDGDLARARRVVPGADGRWKALVDTAQMVDPETRHSVVAWVEGAAVSEPRGFQVVRDWQPLVDVIDPADDDHGPDGKYSYPTDSGWGQNRQMDLRRVRVASAGGALRIEVTTNKITSVWNPANGFDHVTFTVFIELPGGEGGATVMPLQNAALPAGMRWHLRLRAGGWSNTLFSPVGAGPANEGTPVTPAATLRVDRATETVSFIVPAAALGGARLVGAKIYVTTWDYDGGYRPLAEQAQPFAVGGGAPDGVKVMDDSGVIVLP